MIISHILQIDLCRNRYLGGPCGSFFQQSFQLWISSSPKCGHFSSSLTSGRKVVKQLIGPADSCQKESFSFRYDFRCNSWCSIECWNESKLGMTHDLARKDSHDYGNDGELHGCCFSEMMMTPM